jgi:nucleoside-diphosphate-sugar epimerase
VHGPYRRANCHLATLIRDAARGEVTVIPCDPAFVYHYVYVDDVAAAIIAALEAARLPDREYNVGSGEALTMPEVARIAARVLPGSRARLEPGADDVPDRQAVFAIGAIARDLGWTPRYDLARGLVAHRAALPPEAWA